MLNSFLLRSSLTAGSCPRAALPEPTLIRRVNRAKPRRSSTVGSIAAIIRKDLVLELRGAGSTLSLVVFSILVLTVLVVAFGPPPSPAAAAETAAGSLWVALIFSGVLGASRAASAEREGGSIHALLLSPIDTGAIFVAKLATAFVFIAVAETGSMVLVVLFFNLDFSSVLFRLAAIL